MTPHTRKGLVPPLSGSVSLRYVHLGTGCQLHFSVHFSPAQNLNFLPILLPKNRYMSRFWIIKFTINNLNCVSCQNI